MINGGRALGADALYLAFQCDDAGIKLGHRQRIEILSGKLRQRIVAAAGRQIIEVHGMER